MYVNSVTLHCNVEFHSHIPISVMTTASSLWNSATCLLLPNLSTHFHVQILFYTKVYLEDILKKIDIYDTYDKRMMEKNHFLKAHKDSKVTKPRE